MVDFLKKIPTLMGINRVAGGSTPLLMHQNLICFTWLVLVVFIDWHLVCACNQRNMGSHGWAHSCNLCHQWHWQIQGEHYWCVPPQQDQFLSFLHMFSPKSVCIGGWHPPNRLAPPPNGKSWICH